MEALSLGSPWYMPSPGSTCAADYYRGGREITPSLYASSAGSSARSVDIDQLVEEVLPSAAQEVRTPFEYPLTALWAIA